MYNDSTSGTSKPSLKIKKGASWLQTLPRMSCSLKLSNSNLDISKPEITNLWHNKFGNVSQWASLSGLGACLSHLMAKHV
jgi:hypothetical protein